MKAAVYTKYGSPDVLQIEELEKPVPGDNEILIKVMAATVNRTDCAMIRANPFIMRFFTGLLKPKKTIPGTDFAGKIEAVGKDERSLKAGDNIFGFDDLGLRSHAQYMKLAMDKAFTAMPNNFSYEEAATCLEGAHYAFNFINKVNIKSGQKVLVNGAAGAIGSAAVQLLKYSGANVTAVCKSKDEELVKSLGAAKVIDYTKEDFTKGDERYNFIFDTAGKSSFKKCKPLLETDGIYISSELGPKAQNLFFALITLFTKKKVVFPFPTNCKRSVLFIKKLCEKGKFKAVIDRKYKLEDISEAYKYVEQGQKTGNVVITM